jgi:hypothetical protein
VISNQQQEAAEMPKKELETVDRYQIFAETSIEQMGFVLAALTKMGLENIGYKLITDVHQFNSRKVHDVNATEFAAEFVKENPRFKSSELVGHFKAAGREPSGAYYAIKKLTESNIIRKNGDEFVRVEALAAPEKPAKTRPANPVHRFEVKNKDLIAAAIKGRKQFTMADLRAVFASEGRNDKSISPILTGMLKATQIKVVSPGHYMVLAKGTTPAKKETPEQRREKDKLRKQAARAAEKKEVLPAAPELALNGAMMNGSGEAAHHG